MRSAKKTSAQLAHAAVRSAVLGVLAICIAACVYEPYPPPVAEAPAPPGAYYAAPCCNYYPEYPPYYYGYGAPPVALGFAYGGGYGYRHWR